MNDAIIDELVELTLRKQAADAVDAETEEGFDESRKNDRPWSSKLRMALLGMGALGAGYLGWRALAGEKGKELGRGIETAFSGDPDDYTGPGTPKVPLKDKMFGFGEHVAYGGGSGAAMALLPAASRRLLDPIRSSGDVAAPRLRSTIPMGGKSSLSDHLDNMRQLAPRWLSSPIDPGRMGRAWAESAKAVASDAPGAKPGVMEGMSRWLVGDTEAPARAAHGSATEYMANATKSAPAAPPSTPPKPPKNQRGLPQPPPPSAADVELATALRAEPNMQSLTESVKQLQDRRTFMNASVSGVYVQSGNKLLPLASALHTGAVPNVIDAADSGKLFVVTIGSDGRRVTSPFQSVPAVGGGPAFAQFNPNEQIQTANRVDLAEPIDPSVKTQMFFAKQMHVDKLFKLRSQLDEAADAAGKAGDAARKAMISSLASAVDSEILLTNGVGLAAETGRPPSSHLEPSLTGPMREAVTTRAGARSKMIQSMTQMMQHYNAPRGIRRNIRRAVSGGVLGTASPVLADVLYNYLWK